MIHVYVLMYWCIDVRMYSLGARRCSWEASSFSTRDVSDLTSSPAWTWDKQSTHFIHCCLTKGKISYVMKPFLAYQLIFCQFLVIYLKHHIDVHWESETKELSFSCMGPPLQQDGLRGHPKGSPCSLLVRKRHAAGIAGNTRTEGKMII